MTRKIGFFHKVEAKVTNTYKTRFEHTHKSSVSCYVVPTNGNNTNETWTLYSKLLLYEAVVCICFTEFFKILWKQKEKTHSKPGLIPNKKHLQIQQYNASTTHFGNQKQSHNNVAKVCKFFLEQSLPASAQTTSTLCSNYRKFGSSLHHIAKDNLEWLQTNNDTF